MVCHEHNSVATDVLTLVAHVMTIRILTLFFVISIILYYQTYVETFFHRTEISIPQ